MLGDPYLIYCQSVCTGSCYAKYFTNRSWVLKLMISCQGLSFLSYWMFHRWSCILACTLCSINCWSGILFLLGIPAVSSCYIVSCIFIYTWYSANCWSGILYVFWCSGYPWLLYWCSTSGFEWVAKVWNLICTQNWRWVAKVCNLFYACCSTSHYVFLLVFAISLIVGLESSLYLVFWLLLVIVSFHCHVRYNTGLKLMVIDVI